jgi:general secretion pathway protein H
VRDCRRSTAAAGPRSRRQSSPAGGASGFTLIEMLVVLSLMALLMIAVPWIGAGLPGVRLRAAADDLILVLKELHGEAIRRGAMTELVLDPAARAYRISSDGAARRLPASVGEVGFKASAVLPSNAAARVRFFADGSASGGTILLRQGAHSQAIAVDWLTGRVRRQ